MPLTENTDYLLLKTAVRVDGAITNQHKGNMLVTKNYILLNVAHNIDTMEAAFGETGYEQEYRDDNTANPFKNLSASFHNIGVASKEVKKSMDDTRQFYKLEKLIKLNYKIIREKAQAAVSTEELEEEVRKMCLQNDMSLVLRVDQIHEMTSGFFKLGFAGFKLLMRDGLEFKVISGKVKKIRKFLGK